MKVLKYVKEIQMPTSAETYVELLNEMRVHYENRLQGSATGPASPANSAAQKLFSDNILINRASSDPQIRELQEYAERMGKDLAYRSRNGIRDATSVFEKSGHDGISAYKLRLQKLSDRDRAAVNEQNDHIFDKAIELGNRYPSKQSEIIGTVQIASDCFQKLYQEISSFYVEIENNSVTYQPEIWKQIDNKFDSIAKHISQWF
ncbi:hypothetical protein [Pseudomonas entomophila]|uniref:hypothetical protein n=1 Tax=Pseudomonas entomophila TaxID=312306 RepID=UPI003EBC1438